MINMIYLGAPGVGKGTIASVVAKKQGVIHLSTGNLFRNEIAQATPLGLQIKALVEGGSYVDDSITNQLVLQATTKLIESNHSFILDGYPRTLNQAEFLKNNVQITQAILLDAPQDVILERLSGRRNCPTCNRNYHIKFSPSKNGLYCEDDQTLLIQRKDDLPQSIIKRLKTYETQTLPLIKYYKDANLLSTYNANQSPEKTAQQIIKDWY